MQGEQQHCRRIDWMPHPPIRPELDHRRRHRHLLGVLGQVENGMVAHEHHCSNEHPSCEIRPPTGNQVQLRPLAGGQPVADKNKHGESDAERKRESDIPLGIMSARVEVPVETATNSGLEEEEVMVDEEDRNRPALEESIEVRRRDESEPCDGGCDDGELLEEGGLAGGVLVEAVEAVNSKTNSEEPRPEDPTPTEVGPEEGVEEGGDGLPGSEEGEGDDGRPFADGEREMLERSSMEGRVWGRRRSGLCCAR
ncbi:hypothetical protein J5N97_030281 [Dioscorea zingiberensis]|uniref:Uncharacterized protein n=1 Tax=Dioscorea zingiberensis TaxID=325984 RepID=A0A9D5BXD6_9LILI|nr:hypothetical protein J5N97_030281 [Dioscorea zingiberensis]